MTLTAAVPCAGCGEPTPYRVGDHAGEGSFGEFLSTPLGDCYRRTHWNHDCVHRSRREVNGKPIRERVSAAERELQRGASDRSGG